MDKFYVKFINLNFLLLLSPFRVQLVESRDNYGDVKQSYRIVQGHPLHRLLSGTLLSLSVLQGLFITRGAYWGKVVNHPSVLFLIWKTLHNSFLLAVFWGWTFWRKEKHSTFHEILNHLLKQRKSGEIASTSTSTDYDLEEDDSDASLLISELPLTWAFLLSVGLLIPIGTEIVQIFNFDGAGRPPSLEDNFRLSSAQVLFDLCVWKNHTHISRKDFGPSYFHVSVVYMVLRTWGKVLMGMAHVLTFLAAITFYSQVKRLVEEAFTAQCCLKTLVHQFLKLLRFIHHLNNVNRPLLLCLVSGSVPLIVLRVINAWDTPQLSVQLIVLVKLVEFLGIVLVSAEANHKAILLKTRILELCHQHNQTDHDGGSGWAGHIYRSELGLDAGRFVKISLTFIGSMFSAYLSYAIMLLQISPCK